MADIISNQDSGNGIINGFVQVLENIEEIKTNFSHLNLYNQQANGWIRERRDVIRNLRTLADKLEKIHGDVLIADRVGTGVGIGAGILTIGGYFECMVCVIKADLNDVINTTGLVAAPFTAGLSVGLSLVGGGVGFLGGMTSIGSNVTDFLCNKFLLQKMKEELEQHEMSTNQLAQLIPDISKCFDNLSKFRPTLERLAQFSEENLTDLINIAFGIMPQLLKGDANGLYDTFKYVDPEIHQFLDVLRPMVANVKLMPNLAILLTYFKENVRAIKQGISAYVVIRNNPVFVKRAMELSRLDSTAQKSPALVEDLATARSAFKGTPLAMSKSARIVAGTVATAFIAADVYYMIKICSESKETTAVTTLRQIATDFEKEMECY